MRFARSLVGGVLLLALLYPVTFPSAPALAAQPGCPGDGVVLSSAPTPFQPGGVVELRLTNTTAVTAGVTDMAVTWAAWFARNPSISAAPLLQGVYIGGTSPLNADALWVPTASNSALPFVDGSYRPLTREFGTWLAGDAYLIPPAHGLSIWLDFEGDDLTAPPLAMMMGDFNGTRFEITCDVLPSATGPDVNRDGYVTPADAVYVMNRLGMADFTADVDGNGQINTVDVDLVLAALGGEVQPTVTLVPTLTPTPTITRTPTPMALTFDCDLVTLAAVDRDESLSAAERQITFSPNGVTFAIRNGNPVGAVLAGVDLQWGTQAYRDGLSPNPVPDYPLLGTFWIDADATVIWEGDDRIPPTNTETEANGVAFTPVSLAAQSTTNLLVFFDNSPAWLGDVMQRSDFSSTTFTILNPLTNEPCPPGTVRFTLAAGFRPTDTPPQFGGGGG